MAASDGAQKPASLRLFFALWPEDGLRARLARLTSELASECGGRATDGSNLHITLAFLGQAPRDRVDAFIALADRLHGEAFDLQLDTVGHWRRSGITWAGATCVPERLEKLADDMKRALQAIAWPVDERPYQPHVTLLRDADRPPRTRTCALPAWNVRDFVLVRSTQEAGGTRYVVMRRWALAG